MQARNLLVQFKTSYDDKVRNLQKEIGKRFSKDCHIANAMCDLTIEMIDEMNSKGLCLSLYLESFKADGSKVAKSVASKFGRRVGWTLFTLKWLLEMVYGRIQYLTKFTFIEYGAYPSSDGGMYSYLRCKEFLVYMKAMYREKAVSLLK